MNDYDNIQNVNDKAEARDFALMAAQVVRWAGYTNLSFDDALPVAWEGFGKAATFIKTNVAAEERKDG